MNLSEYIIKRNGVPMGHPNSLRNNLRRSLGAKNFSSFWNFWNPIFGYYLGKRIFKPLKNRLHLSVAVVLTFVFCGVIHDLVTIVVRGNLSLFFSIWFFFMGISVVFTKYINYDLSQKAWLIRAITNASIIIVCVLITIWLNSIFEFY